MTQEFVTLPREVVERALASLESEFGKHSKSASDIRAALKQPQNHVSDAGNMVPAGWKLVPVEPNCSMVLAGERSLERHDFLRLDSAYRAMLAAAPQPPAPGCKATKRGDHVVCDDCKSAWDANDKNPPACVPAPPALEQPQANQPAMTPIAQHKLEDLMASGYTISGYSVYHERKHQHGFVTGAGLVGWWNPDGVEYPKPRGEQEPDWSDSKTLPSELWKNPLLSLQERLQIADGAVQWNREVAENLRARLRAAQQPQPKREPLTDDQIDAIADAMPGGLEGFLKGWGWRQFARAVLENAHNIK